MHLSDLIQEWREQNKVHCLEGTAGIKSFEHLCTVLGYGSTNLRFGTPIEEFLSDNSGALEALIGWIGVQNLPDWAEAVESHLIERELDDNE